MTELELLEQLYLEDLTKIVNYGGGDRPRVRHPQKWVNALSFLKEEQKKKGPMLNLNDKRVFIWSDQHFFHKNIIKFAERPFPDVQTMNEMLIANHNVYVGKDDVVIWNGDVGIANETKINNLLDQCNGYKILVIGNHDFHRRKRPLKLNFDEIHLCYMIEYPEVSLFLTHYPMYNIPEPWINIHGHLHAFPNPISDHPRHINVNCEVQNYCPILLDDVARKAKICAISSAM